MPAIGHGTVRQRLCKVKPCSVSVCNVGTMVLLPWRTNTSPRMARIRIFWIWPSCTTSVVTTGCGLWTQLSSDHNQVVFVFEDATLLDQPRVSTEPSVTGTSSPQKFSHKLTFFHLPPTSRRTRSSGLRTSLPPALSVPSANRASWHSRPHRA